MGNPELTDPLPPVTLYRDPGLDRILYATWLVMASLVVAVAFVLWRGVR